MKIGVVGATGLVGNTLIKILEEENIKIDSLILFASKKSSRKTISYLKGKIPVETLKDEKDLSGFDYLFFTADSDIAEKYAPNAAKNGAVVIDNSTFFRMQNDIPLIMPEINGNLLKGYKGIIANPNCVTIQMLQAVYQLYKEFGIQEIIVSTYQAVSGVGSDGIKELENQKKGLMDFKVFPNQIFENVIPQVGEVKETNETEEEYKMVNETKKILKDPLLRIFSTCVRVPVVNGHSESIYLRTIKPYSSIENVKSILMKSENVIIGNKIITPKEIDGKNDTYISRIRVFGRKVVMMWVVADNLRVGAATNAVRILKKHMELNKK
jgi:aspartate-semialdehyde dehydrogenase